MISIRSSADMERALAGPMNPPLRELLTTRRDQLADEELDLGELVQIIVVQLGDTLAQVEAEAGVALATNYGDGTRLGEPDFTPSFESVELIDGCLWEAVMILSDDGWGLVLIIPDRIDFDPALTLLMRRAAA